MIRKIIIATALTATGFGLSNIAAAASIKTEAEKQSYAAGYMQGETLQKLKTELRIDLNSDLFQQGLKDGLTNTKPALSDQEIKQALVSLQQTIFAKQKDVMDKKFGENKSKSEAFLAKIKKEKNIKSLTDGILYKINKSSSQKVASPTANDTVEVNYKGTKIDGKEFDSGKNTKLALNSVIKGWQTALTSMKPGDNWTIYIPSKDAYGERGAPNIMPNSALIFDIELIKVIPNKK